MGVYRGEDQSIDGTFYRDEPMEIAGDEVYYEKIWTDDEDDNESIS